ncbi:MAG TPA: hypothetical protein P5330_12880, partial [Candidatus Competibacteraceae bacterium]|nr:hypothetical protein [Candidatus Competibacteraceae bacterium]
MPDLAPSFRILAASVKVFCHTILPDSVLVSFISNMALLSKVLPLKRIGMLLFILSLTLVWANRVHCATVNIPAVAAPAANVVDVNETPAVPLEKVSLQLVW